MAREHFRFGAGSKKFTRHSEKNLTPLFPKTCATIAAFPVCELRRGGFVCKKNYAICLTCSPFTGDNSPPY
nr:hypothetical protein [Porphyromonas gulae]